MNKKVLIPTILFLIMLPSSIFVLTNERSIKQKAAEARAANVDSKIVLYYSDICPHCKLVEKFLADNGVAEKISFAQKNVHNNVFNSDELTARATLCNIPSKDLGVPFLWDGENGNKCIVGDEDIISYFKNLINLK